MAKGISLHIGLNSVNPNSYAGWDGKLNACEADANDMQALVNSRGFKSNKLLTAKATRAAVAAGISDAAKKLVLGDMFLLTYSGHGGQHRTRTVTRLTARMKPGCSMTVKLLTTSYMPHGANLRRGYAFLYCQTAVIAGLSCGM